LISQFEIDYPAERSDILLWKSFFRSNIDYVTICNLCISRIKISERKEGSNRKSETHPTRPGDISSDDEDEFICFKPLIVYGSSMEGKMMSKWLNAARKKVGGTFPRSHAKTHVNKYIEQMKLQKKQQNNKTRLDQNKNGNFKWAPIHVNDASKALMSKWVLTAKQNASLRYSTLGNQIKQEIVRVLDCMPPTDDWYYGRELRLDGIELHKVSEELVKRKKGILEKETRDMETVENSKNDYNTEMNAKLRRKRKELERKLALAFSELQIKAKLRVRDLQFKINQQQNTMEARMQEDTITSQMKLSLKEKLTLYEASIQEETCNTQNTWKKVKLEYTEIFAQEERIMVRSVRDRQRDYKLERECIQQKYKEQLEPEEKEWRSNATKWLNITKRKIAVKATEADSK